jgi:hypothetical protein
VPDVKRLFARKVKVPFGKMYFQGAVNEWPDMKMCFDRQENGLCGARMRSLLLLITCVHTGCVNVTVDLWDSEPPLGDSWEEAVEVSFVVNDPEWTGIWVGWGSEGWHPIDLRPGKYRVRYCARNMDTGQRKDAPSSGREEPTDEYSLSFWVASGAHDRVIRQTSEIAAYWHQWARRLSAPDGS